MRFFLFLFLMIFTLNTYSQDKIYHLDTFPSMSWNDFYNKHYELLGLEFNCCLIPIYHDIQENDSSLHIISYFQTNARGDRRHYEIKCEDSTLYNIENRIVKGKHRDSVVNTNLEKSKTYFYQEIFTDAYEGDIMLMRKHGYSFIFIIVDNYHVRYVVNSKGAFQANDILQMDSILNNPYIKADFQLFIDLWNKHVELEKQEEEQNKWRFFKRRRKFD